MSEGPPEQQVASAGGEGAARWSPGDSVSVTRLRSGQHAMARVMGVGLLLDRLAVGGEVRIRLDDGLALAPSRVLSLEAVSGDAVIIETRNHRYEIRRIEGMPSAAGRLSIHDVDPGRGDGFQTGVIRIDDWPEPDPTSFEEGARVRVVKQDDEGRSELGQGILLCDLTPGEPLSLAIDETVLATSPVTAVRVIGADEVDVATARSRYTLRLCGGADEADPRVDT